MSSGQSSRRSKSARLHPRSEHKDNHSYQTHKRPWQTEMRSLKDQISRGEQLRLEGALEGP